MKRLAYIDVLRAIAILTVFIHHLPLPFGDVWGPLQLWGGRGVDLFFVLSGFLIGSTTLQRASSGASRTAQAKVYWLLRTVRIWPLYFLLLALYAAKLPLLDPVVTQMVRQYPFPYLTFTSNDFGQITLELGIFWSLAIEEQFYLAVNLLILSCSRRRDVLAGAFTGIALAAIAASLRYRYELHLLDVNGVVQGNQYVFKLFHSTLARIDQLALGLLTAVLANAFNQAQWARSPRFATLSTWAGVLVCLAFLVFYPHQPIFGFLAIGLAFAACVLWAQRPGARAVTPGRIEAFLLGALGQVGKLSFGLYVLHPITRSWMTALFERGSVALTARSAYLFMGGWFSMTMVLSYLSYRFFEGPLLTWARDRSTAALEPQLTRPV